MKKVAHLISLLSLILLFSHSCKPKQKLSKEHLLRKELGIPLNVDSVIILSQAAHMDWDWLNNFPYNSDEIPPEYKSYFGGQTQPADSILNSATPLFQNPAYHYSVCEMAFLQAFSKKYPTQFKAMLNSGRLAIVGGGITSPDNQVCNGEAFLRNFLVGKTWMDSVALPWTGQIWLPDDFGHDSQLPAMLAALEAEGVGFSRVPGGVQQQTNYAPAGEAAANILLGFGKNTVDKGGVTFNWKANDGSKVIAHWLEAHYSQGNNIDENGSRTYTSPADVNNRSQSGFVQCPNNDIDSCVRQHIMDYFLSNGPVSPTPYVYVQVSDDFILPKQDLVAYAAAFNKVYSPKLHAVVSNFDNYIHLVDAYNQKTGNTALKTRSFYPNTSSNTLEFQPAPYWMGYYASRPELKLLQNRATQQLVAGEIALNIANNLFPPSSYQLQQQAIELADAWADLVPSSHHDYVTGTAMDSVYLNEQIPLLQTSLSKARGLTNKPLQVLASNISAPAGSALIFNPLGFSNNGVVQFQTPGRPTYVYAQAPSMGYQVVNTAQQSSVGLLSLTANAGVYTLSNDSLSASINAKGQLIAVIDKQSGQNIISQSGNELLFFNDLGGIYRFGYGQGNPFSLANPTISNIQIDTFSQGNFIKTIRVTQNIQLGSNKETFIQEYSLHPRESMLRMSTTGQLPSNYTAMTSFNLLSTVDSIEFGTPYHWDCHAVGTYGPNTSFNAIFEATHDFVIPKSNGKRMAAIYHGGTPAWTAKGNTVYGVLLRNTPANSSFGAYGHDYGTHTQHYALRVPSGLSSPISGRPLKEARRFNTPMQGVLISTGASGNLPHQYSFISYNGPGLVTAAKAPSQTPFNNLILRFYQPTNSSYSGSLTLAKTYRTVEFVTAVETLGKNPPGTVSLVSGNTIKLTMNRAIGTIKVSH